MTDRIKGFVVTLDHDIRTDDCDGIKNAILHIKGVLDVSDNLVEADDFINRSRIESEIRRKIFEVF